MMKLPPQVNTALDLLEAAGFEAFLVGGAVRDAVRGVPSGTDWDITTSALPEQTKDVFADYRLIETGLKHGTVTVLIDRVPLEITTYRIDGDYTDHRRPDSVRFTRNLKDDLARRDFTMNALAYHPKAGIIDPFGGQDDLARGLIRCVGEPNRRFQEDGLRILRALRFASVFEMTLEPETSAAIHRNKELLRHIAVERLQTELTKLLCGVGVSAILRNYRDVFAELIPELIPTFDFEQHNPHHDKDVWRHTAAVVSAVHPSPVLRWAALLHDVGKPGCFAIDEGGVGHFYGHAEKSTALAEQILARLRMDNDRRERIVRLVRYHDMPITAEEKLVKRLLNKHGVETARELIELHRADTLGLSPAYHGRLSQFDASERLLDELLQQEACFSLRDLAVNGRDMLALGLAGKEIGWALDRCLNAVMDGQLPNEREPLLAHVREHLVY